MPINYRHLVSQEEAKIRLPLLGIVNYIESGREHKTEFFCHKIFEDLQHNFNQDKSITMTKRTENQFLK